MNIEIIISQNTYICYLVHYKTREFKQVEIYISSLLNRIDYISVQANKIINKRYIIKK